MNPAMPRPRLPILYASTIVLSSFLLFLIQPVFAKLILPWFGGSAAVWTTCLVFFQSFLLLAYIYAHLLTRRLSRAHQAYLHSALLGAGLLLLPVIPGEFWKSGANVSPELRILLLLTCVLGLPYFLVASTTPLLQRWFLEATGLRPYRLFAWSNAASLLALVAYPFFIEPHLPTRTQATAWSFAFAAFAVLCAAGAWVGRSTAAPALPDRRDARDAAVHRRSLVEWTALAAAGSMLLVATTSQLTQNVAAVPFLWILPLAVYLLSFILCFEYPNIYRRGLFLRLLAVALGATGYAIYDIHTSDALAVAVPIFTLGLFVCCMYCHGEINLRKPGPSSLTSFYLCIALGGALGAVVLGIVAPLVFSGLYDLAFSLCFVALLAWWLNWGEGWAQRLLWSVAFLAMVIVFYSQVDGYERNSLVLTRGFYGTLRVVRSSLLGGEVRALYHGTIEHGSQCFLPERRMIPTTYYGLSSGAGLALSMGFHRSRSVGVIGLGAGTLAAYGRPGDTFRFYEINPQVVSIAKTWFSYLRETPAHVEIALGDARLSLSAEPAHQFDVLVVDAFSGDAIPVHLLTREAMALYLRHLAPGGLLLFHVSNQYLDLAPIVGQLASSLGCRSAFIHSEGDGSRLLNSADWVLVSRNEEVWKDASIARRAHPIAVPPALIAWTDDYNDLFEILRLVPASRPR